VYYDDNGYDDDDDDDNDEDDDNEGDLDEEIVYWMNEVENHQREANRLNSNANLLRMENERLDMELQQSYGTILSLLGGTTTTSSQETTVDDNDGGGVGYGGRSSNSHQLFSEQLSAASSQQRSIVNLAIQHRLLPIAILPSFVNDNTTTSCYDDPRSTSESTSLSLQSLSIDDNGNEQQHLERQQQMATTSINTTNSSTGICPRPLLHELSMQAIIEDNEQESRKVDEMFSEVVEDSTKTTSEINTKLQQQKK